MNEFIEPTLPIYEAVLLIQGQQADLIGYEQGGVKHVAHRDDLAKMATMGLDTLPVECIAIPENSSLLHVDRGQLSAKADYSRQLSKHFPVYFVAALYELQSLILRFDAKAYVIGGITRDLLMFTQKRREVQDVDITVEGNAIELADFLAEHSRNFQVMEQYPEFGTAKVQYKGSLMFDFASTRQEIYPNCGALPVVVKRGVPLVDDIIRRDFTVNALAFSIHELGQVLDYSNGIRDIQSRTLQVLHPVSFFEDPSRILRALKFCARFDFELADETRQLIAHFLRCGTLHYKGGGDRIKQELKGLLSAECTAKKKRWIHFFMESGCYRLMNTESDYQPTEESLAMLDALPQHLPTIQNTLSNHVDKDFQFDVYLCFLCRDMPEEDFQKTASRLGLTRNERDFVEQFRRLKDSIADRLTLVHEYSSPAEIYDLFHGIHFIAVCAGLAQLACNDIRSMRHVLEAFMTYKRKWEKLQLELDGNDLIELGVPEGKTIGKLLDNLLHAKLAGQVPERLDEVQYIQTHLQKQQEQQPQPSKEEASDAQPS